MLRLKMKLRLLLQLLVQEVDQGVVGQLQDVHVDAEEVHLKQSKLFATPARP